MSSPGGAGSSSTTSSVGAGRRRCRATRSTPRGLITLVPDLLERDVYVCAPAPMMRSVDAALKVLGVPRAADPCRTVRLLGAGDTAMVHIPRRAATALAGTAVVTVLLLSRSRHPPSWSRRQAPRPTRHRRGRRRRDRLAAAGRSQGGASATPAHRPTRPRRPRGTADATEVTGPTVSTRYGPVQVMIEVSGGTITDVVALQLPSGGRSGRISDVAEPTLHDEALTAQSAADRRCLRRDVHEPRLRAEPAGRDRPGRDLNGVAIRVEHVMGTAVSLDMRGAPTPGRRPWMPPSPTSATWTPASAPIGPTARSPVWPGASSVTRTRATTSGTCSRSATTSRRPAAAPSMRERRGPGGGLDPSGYVKGWAVEEAAWLLDSAGATDYLLNAGGDILARGEASPGQPWRVGIRHPDRAGPLAAVLEVRDRAVATSATYERGRPHRRPADRASGRAAQEHDGRGSAARVRGCLCDGRLRHGARRASAGWPAIADHEALAITNDDRVVWTEGFRALPGLDDGRRRRLLADRRPAAGRQSSRHPPAGWTTAIRPPWRSTIQAAIARPRPVPPPGAPCAR